MAEPIAERPAQQPPTGGADETAVQPTVPLEPVRSGDTEVLQPARTVVVEKPAPKKRKRGWIGWVIAIVLLSLLVVAFFIADNYARQYARDYVRDRIIQVLGIDPASDVDVQLGGGSIILQALTGGIGEVDVSIAELTFGELTGVADIHATDVPLDSAQPVGTLDISVTVDEENVQKLAGFMSGLELSRIELGDGVITIGTQFNLIFFSVPVAVDLLPSAVEGGISFDPQTILVGDDEISVADLRDSPEFSALAGDLLQSQDFCVSSYLPQALSIADVDVVGSTLVVAITGDGARLGGPELSTMGTCPAG